MKRNLLVVICVLALTLVSMTSAFAGCNWDEDPILKVGEQTVQVWFAADNLSAFCAGGGKILVTATAPKIKLMSQSPCTSTTVVQSGQSGELKLTVTMVGKNAPNKFDVRVFIPAKNWEKVQRMQSGNTWRVELPH